MGKKVFTTVIGDRKAAAARLAEITGQKAVYTRAPRFAYQVGGIFIERDGSVTAMKGADMDPLRKLADEGFCEALVEQATEDGQKHGQEADTDRTRTDKTGQNRTEGLTIGFPKGDFTDDSLANLEKILAAKAGLIKKALGADRLTIDASDDEWVYFPWWDTMPTTDEATAYCAFIAAVCKLAKKAKRVTAKETPVDSEKYAFRIFLLRLGFIGPDHKAERRILLSKLSGSAAFVSEDAAAAFAEAQKEKRNAEKGQEGRNENL